MVDLLSAAAFGFALGLAVQEFNFRHIVRQLDEIVAAAERAGIQMPRKR